MVWMEEYMEIGAKVVMSLFKFFYLNPQFSNFSQFLLLTSLSVLVSKLAQLLLKYLEKVYEW